MLPLQKRAKSRMGVRQVESKESLRHRKFVRSFVCIVNGGTAGSVCNEGPIVFCHVRAGLPEGEQAGVSRKPHDCFGFPACRSHHDQQHRIGEESFEKIHGVKLLDTALLLARASPCPRVKAKAQELYAQKILTELGK